MIIKGVNGLHHCPGQRKMLVSARNSQEQSGTVGNSQEQLGTVRNSREQSGAAGTAAGSSACLIRQLYAESNPKRDFEIFHLH